MARIEIAAEDHGKSGALQRAIKRAFDPMLPHWKPIETLPHEPGKFFAGLWVEISPGPRYEWQQHYVWLDPDVREIDAECDQGWGLEDYTHWFPCITLPLPPERT